MDIISLYEDLKKYIICNGYDNLFYNAPEGEIQIDIVKEMLDEIKDKL